VAVGPTVLRFRLPGAAFGVAVDDVLNNGCVYVRDLGLFVAQDPPKVSLAEYKQQIAGKQTVLQEVHARPDQTFAKATEVLHNPKQNLQPTLLSLACDNHKVIAHRNGELQFRPSPEADDQHVQKPLDQSGRISPKFGSGKNEKLTRTLDGAGCRFRWSRSRRTGFATGSGRLWPRWAEVRRARSR